jgi:hypothetical protein
MPVSLTVAQDIASHLVQRVTDVTAPVHDTNHTSNNQFPDLSIYFANLPLPRKDVTSRQRIELDQKGVQLWNACCGIDSSEGVDEKVKLRIAQCELKIQFSILENIVAILTSL